MTPAGAAPPTRSRAGTIVPPTKSRPVVPTRTMTDVTTTAATTAAAAIDAMTTTGWTISTVSGRNSPNFCTAQRAATGRRTAVIPTFAAETTSPATMWMSVMTATVVTRIVTTSVSSVLRPAATATTPVVTTAPTARRAPAASSAASAAWEASAASAASVPICLRAARGRASACP